MYYVLKLHKIKPNRGSQDVENATKQSEHHENTVEVVG